MDNPGYNGDDNNGRPYIISRPTSGGKQVESAEYLVTVSSRFNPSKKSVYYRRASVVLFVLVVILTIGIIILLVLYSKSSSKHKICTSAECLRSSANFKYSIDFGTDPCDNFYQYCCGKWSEEHPNHGWYTSFSTFSTISEKILIEIMKILSSDSEEDEPYPVTQAKYFYESCIDTDALDVLGISVMFKYLKMVGLSLVPSVFAPDLGSNFSWVKTEASIKQVFAMDVFIGFTVQPNIFKREQNVIYLGVLYQNCPLPSPIKVKKTKGSKKVDESEEDETELQFKVVARSKIIRFLINEFARNLSLSSPKKEVLQLAVDVVNNITERVEELTANYTQPDDGEGEDETKNMTFRQLQEFTANNVPNLDPMFWVTYVDAIFENTNVTIEPDVDLLYVTETELTYLYKILEYVTSLPEKHLEIYLWWSTVYAMVINTSADVVDYITKQMSVVYGDSDVAYSRSRALDCCELVNNYMGLAVSYAIADKAFPNKTKPKVEKMFHEIKDAFVQHVKSVAWMDDYTKKVTLEKSREMISFIGYPDWLFVDGALERHFEGLEINSTTYLDNMMSVIIDFTNETLTSLRAEHKRDWSTEPINVNAFNSFTDNAINVPIAILNYPMYNLGLEVLNYGSIGAILGHELTHGFDNTGRKHDKYGNYVQWWSNKTIETFENMTSCFVDQYDNFTIEGIEGHIKGKATLGENLADNGGLNQAYTAYKNYAKRYGREPKLPGFENFTSDQLFFIAYGSIWCESSTAEDLRNQLEYDEHCPNSVRVVGTLQNSDAFAKAFKCPRGSPMNPKRRKCQIW
ncbi:endothelin-converting enzyme homolog [Cylas formicarius]|uniref:endothelin-converting enzyme homolog n=1 Tax=Cylas formicarius TaxID=197179 RepID=UPI002958D474|nr:endothelin-converting enzyme homolog [Cylas formicarius]